MYEFLTRGKYTYWGRSSIFWVVVSRHRSACQLICKLAFAFAFIMTVGMLESSPNAEAARCGAKNQRPCSIFERIPSCNRGLVEDFKKGRCVTKAVPGRDCGRANQRPCKVWERIPSCNKGLVEDFKKGRCVTKAVPGRDCGRANQRPCKVWERIPSCNKGLVEHLPSNRCTTIADLGSKFKCGKRNQKPCKVLERVPSCDKGLVEHLPSNRCTSLADLGNKYKCGKRNQKPCKVLERIPSCDKGLVEHLPSNQCTSLADLGNKYKCGKRYQKPCKVLERIPSCDSGLVEDFLKGKCVPSEDAERHRIAEQKLKKIGGFVASKVGFATNVANNPQVRNSLNGSDKTAVARVVNKSGVGQKQMPDGHLLRTLTVGATVGGKVLFVGTSGGAGAAIDLKGERPAYAYATGDYSFGPGLAAGGGIDVGFWVCQNNKIGGDSWGVEFGVDDLVLAFKGAASLKKGPSLGIGLWFNYSNVFQGFTITPGFGIGADFGGVVKAATAVEDDSSVECDGRRKANFVPSPKSSPGLGSKFGSNRSKSKAGANLGTKSPPVSRPPSRSTISINFQPAGAPLPNGFQVDDGSQYRSARGYGWSTFVNTRDRNRHSDQRLDTMVFANFPATWSYNLPNGKYLISLASGDASWAQGPHQVLVEGTRVINGKSTAANQFITVRDHPVTISDGTLTINIGGLGGYTMLNYVQITPAGGITSLPRP